MKIMTYRCTRCGRNEFFGKAGKWYCKKCNLPIDKPDITIKHGKVVIIR